MAKVVRRAKEIKEEKRSKEKKEIIAEESLLDQVETQLNEDGVSLFVNDNVEEDYLQLPRDITEEDSKELGKYLNAFTQQKMWTRTLIGRTSTTIREMSRKLDSVRADVYNGLPAKMSVKEKDLHFQTSRQARNTLDNMASYEERLRLLSDYLNNLEDGIFNISREISRRSADWNEDRRVDNVNKKRR